MRTKQPKEPPPSGGRCPEDEQLKPTFLRKKLTLTPEMVTGTAARGTGTVAYQKRQQLLRRPRRRGKEADVQLSATLRGGMEPSEEVGSIVLRESTASARAGAAAPVG
jgi:hypothetical protein